MRVTGTCKSRNWKFADKPGSVGCILTGSTHRAVIPLGVTLPQRSSSLPGSNADHANAPLFGLAPDGVYRAGPVTSPAVGSYPTVSPLPVPCKMAIGGLLSVALSVASRRPAVSRHPVLRGPDFPPRTNTQRLPGELPEAGLYASPSAEDRELIRMRAPHARKPHRSGKI